MENRKFLKKELLKTKVCLIVAAVLFVVLLVKSYFSQQQWILFHAADIKGAAVDTDTLEPIDDVIVVAMWRLTQVPGEGFGGYANIVQTQTNKKGQFLIPSWTAFKPWKFISVVHEHAPEFVIYKPGYKIHYSSQAKVAVTYPQIMTDAELKKSIEEHSINPAKLIKVYRDGQILENHKEFRSRSRFPDTCYTKDQLRAIFKAIERNAGQLPAENELSHRLLLKDIQEDRALYAGGE